MALGLIHLVACAVFMGGLMGAHGNSMRAIGWGLVAVTWIVTGIILAIEAIV